MRGSINPATLIHFVDAAESCPGINLLIFSADMACLEDVVR